MIIWPVTAAPFPTVLPPQGFSVQGQYGAVAPAEVSDPQPETPLPESPPLTSDPVLWPRSPSSSSSQATLFPLPQPVWCQVSSSG